MAITCPKCSYKRLPEDSAPEYECPKCGVIYAKFKPRQTSTVEVDSRSSMKAPDSYHHDSALDEPIHSKLRWINKRESKVLIGAIFTTFVVGYFSGREHLKYEMRSAFSDVAAGLTRAFADDTQKPNESRQMQIKAPQSQPISPKLLRKSWHEGEYGRNAVIFAVEFSNLTGKSVRAFDGTVVFTDLLGNEVYASKLAVNDRVAAGSSLIWEGKLDYNQFMTSHERLRNAKVENIKVVYKVKRVMFEDGDVKEYSP